MPPACFRPRSLMRPAPSTARQTTGFDAMTDLLWLAATGGLIAATLGYIRLCDGA